MGDNLHELIGSADAKKYRNFAQGLTFEMLVGHANQQLQKMTDRYLLARGYTQPLELRRGVVSDSRYNFHLFPISIIEIKQDRGNVPLSFSPYSGSQKSIHYVKPLILILNQDSFYFSGIVRMKSMAL